MQELEKKELLEIFAVIVLEQHSFSDALHRTFFFYSSFLSTLLVACVIGATQIDKISNFWWLLLITAIIAMISFNAIKTIQNFYKSLFEVITIRAKLEQSVGMTKASNLVNLENAYWQKETLIPKRHLQGRGSKESSEKFINEVAFKGMYVNMRRVFLLFVVLAAVLSIIFVLLALGVIEIN